MVSVIEKDLSHTSSALPWNPNLVNRLCVLLCAETPPLMSCFHVHQVCDNTSHCNPSLAVYKNFIIYISSALSMNSITWELLVINWSILSSCFSTSISWIAWNILFMARLISSLDVSQVFVVVSAQNSLESLSQLMMYVMPFVVAISNWMQQFSSQYKDVQNLIRLVWNLNLNTATFVICALLRTTWSNSSSSLNILLPPIKLPLIVSCVLASNEDIISRQGALRDGPLRFQRTKALRLYSSHFRHHNTYQLSTAAAERYVCSM